MGRPTGEGGERLVNTREPTGEGGGFDGESRNRGGNAGELIVWAAFGQRPKQAVGVKQKKYVSTNKKKGKNGKNNVHGTSKEIEPIAESDPPINSRRAGPISLFSIIGPAARNPFRPWEGLAPAKRLASCAQGSLDDGRSGKKGSGRSSEIADTH